MFHPSLLFSSFLLFTSLAPGLASDEPNLQDFCPAAPPHHPIFVNGYPCKDPSTVLASDFKSTLLSRRGDTHNILLSATVIADVSRFPGVNTLGIAPARIDIDIDGIVLAHSHPRSSEMLFLARGSIVAGFIDTAGQVFQKLLRAGDVFVVPRGLMHFCLNSGFEFATIFSFHNSQNPGLVDISGVIFGSDVDDAKKMKLRLESMGKTNFDYTGHQGASDGGGKVGFSETEHHSEL